MVILNNNIVLLDVTRDSIDPEEIVGGIIIPHSKQNALTKTITCKIKDLNDWTAKEYGLKVGDEILVDRYAIYQHNKMADSSKEFNAFINAKSIIMVHVAA